VIQPPEVVPGIARVTVRVPGDVRRVSIRPVYWRAGSRGAPSADQARRVDGETGTFQGSLWLMARGAYTVDVILEGARGNANVMVPVASVATGRLAMTPALTSLLLVLGIVLCAGLVNIVYKAAGESLLDARESLNQARRRGARRAAAIAIPALGLALLGGARWWTAVDTDYERTMYRPSPLKLTLDSGALKLRATDTLWQPPGRISTLVPDHGKLMHLFLVRSDDARAFAHLHPRAMDASASPEFSTALPPLPAGNYHVYGDVVHETGFERTLIGSLRLSDSTRRQAATDPDDAWYVGDASREGTTTLADGSAMRLEMLPRGSIDAGRDATIRVTITDATGKPARLEPYLGMAAHAVVVRVDGSVYVHLHPMGSITMAAQDAFLARDRGDTTPEGKLRTLAHDVRPLAPSPESAQPTLQASSTSIEFPYAFPKGGSYRLFIQAKRNGRVLTGAFAVAVAESSVAAR
jgi:hypothetical protein